MRSQGASESYRAGGAIGHSRHCISVRRAGLVDLSDPSIEYRGATPTRPRVESLQTIMNEVAWGGSRQFICELRNGSLFYNGTCQLPARAVLILAVCWIRSTFRDPDYVESLMVYVAEMPGSIKDDDWNDRRDTIEQVRCKFDVPCDPGGIIAIASEPPARGNARNFGFQCRDGLVDCRDEQWGKVDEKVANESGEAEMQVGFNKPGKQALPLEVHHSGGGASNLPHMREATHGADPARNAIYRECLDWREGSMCHRDDIAPEEDGIFLIVCSGSGRWTRQVVKR